jgi:hypothetical protein
VGWSSGAGHRGCGPRGADSWQIDNRLDLTCSSMDLARLRAWRSPTPWRSPTAAEVELGGCGLLPAAAACSHEIRQPPPWAALCVCPSVRPSLPPSLGWRESNDDGWEEMQQRERDPRNAVARGGHRKMQQQMQLLLEPLQYTSVLQYADAALDAVAAGVGLKVASIRIFLSPFCKNIWSVRNLAKLYFCRCDPRQ